MDINFYKVWFSTVNDSFVFGINGMVTTVLQQLILISTENLWHQVKFPKECNKTIFFVKLNQNEL